MKRFSMILVVGARSWLAMALAASLFASCDLSGMLGLRPKPPGPDEARIERFSILPSENHSLIKPYLGEINGDVIKIHIPYNVARKGVPLLATIKTNKGEVFPKEPQSIHQGATYTLVAEGKKFPYLVEAFIDNKTATYLQVESPFYVEGNQKIPIEDYYISYEDEKINLELPHDILQKLHGNPIGFSTIGIEEGATSDLMKLVYGNPMPYAISVLSPDEDHRDAFILDMGLIKADITKLQKLEANVTQEENIVKNFDGMEISLENYRKWLNSNTTDADNTIVGPSVPGASGDSYYQEIIQFLSIKTALNIENKSLNKPYFHLPSTNIENHHLQPIKYMLNGATTIKTGHNYKKYLNKLHPVYEDSLNIQSKVNKEIMLDSSIFVNAGITIPSYEETTSFGEVILFTGNYRLAEKNLFSFQVTGGGWQQISRPRDVFTSGIFTIMFPLMGDLVYEHTPGDFYLFSRLKATLDPNALVENLVLGDHVENALITSTSLTFPLKREIREGFIASFDLVDKNTGIRRNHVILIRAGQS